MLVGWYYWSILACYRYICIPVYVFQYMLLYMHIFIDNHIWEIIAKCVYIWPTYQYQNCFTPQYWYQPRLINLFLEYTHQPGKYAKHVINSWFRGDGLVAIRENFESFTVRFLKITFACAYYIIHYLLLATCLCTADKGLCFFFFFLLVTWNISPPLMKYVWAKLFWLTALILELNS